MKTQFAAAFLALCLVAAPAVPAFAAVTVRDAQGVAHLNLDTQIIPQRGAGYYGGSLQLTISPGGIVNGYYRADDSGTPRTVTGGLDGDKIWFDLGPDGPHISGVLSGDHIVGQTFIGTHFFDFKALPVIHQS
jgi:hypothetical protein